MDLREILKNIAIETGFRDIKFDTVSTINKPHRDFTLFIMRAVR